MARRPPPDPVFTLKGCMQPVHSLMICLKDDEEFVYAGTQEGKVHLWDLKKKRENKSYKVGDETCLALHILQNDTIITQEKCGYYKIWTENRLTKELLLKSTISLPYYGFCRSVVSEKYKFLVCPLSDSAVKLIYFDDIKNEELMFCDEDNNTAKNVGEVMVIKYFDNLILVAYESGVFKIWSISSNQCLCRVDFLLECPMALDIKNFSTLNDKLFGYVGSCTDIVTEFSIDIDRQIPSVNVLKKREIMLTNPGVSCIKIRPDCKLFAVGCWDKRLRLFSCKSLQLLVVLDFHKDVIQDIIFSYKNVKSCSCQYLLASGSLDGRISLWDLYN